MTFFPTHRFPAASNELAIEEQVTSRGALGLSTLRKEQNNLQRIMTLMEPVVIMSTGVIIALMVMSMFTAIFGINDIKF